MKKQTNIALFASGSGSNVENIFNFFKKNDKINIICVLCNNKNAYVLERCKYIGIKSFVFDKQDFRNPDIILNYLKENEIDLIVLAGFLWLIPEYLIEKFPNKIINIHPALLPKYGGKGMYGENVHKAVFENKETETGITVHFVNKNYDEGNIIEQKSVKIEENDTPETIAHKVHELEYEYFPQVIERVCNLTQNFGL